MRNAGLDEAQAGIKPGIQASSSTGPGKSGLHARGEGERVLALVIPACASSSPAFLMMYYA